MPVFLAQDIIGQEAFLDEEESRHLIRVLRLKEGAPVDLVDGKGNLYKGLISLADFHKTTVRILESFKDHLAREYSIHIAIAPTKSTDRFEWFLEKATEIGVDEISPILCTRSERSRIRHDRSEKILMTAMKQSGRARLPRLNPMVPFTEFVTREEADIKYIAHCRTKPGVLPEKPASGKLSWLVLIGPEGDFTSEEVDRALSGNFTEINLGEAVYRTETAGIMACQLINFLNNS